MVALGKPYLWPGKAGLGAERPEAGPSTVRGQAELSWGTTVRTGADRADGRNARGGCRQTEASWLCR